MADYIPFEIKVEIMKRLPTKSLMRFRSVSKPYKSLIDSSEFIADYSFNHTHQHHLLVTYYESKKVEHNRISFVDNDTFPQDKFSLTVPLPGLHQSWIVGSSQGLFCLESLIRDPSDPRTLNTKLVLWNPSIRKSVVIDVPNVSDQRNGLDVIGFGVCPHTGDPKIVSINYTHWQVEVYTLSSGAWRRIPTITHPRNSIDFTWKQVVAVDYIYWFAIDYREGLSYNMIVSFDLTSENLKEVSLPDTLAHANKHNVDISKLKESLVVLEIVTEKRVCGVLMMEPGVSNTFTKLFNIILPDASIHRVLGFRKNDEPIFEMKSDVGVDEGVLVQELHSEHINCVLMSAKGYLHSACSYMETLLLLDH